jgi:hypothetical protein
MITDVTTIYFTGSRHVLGAITRSTGPTGKETAADLVGTDGLALRVPNRPELQVLVDVAQLSVQSVAANDDLMTNPANFQLSDPTQSPVTVVAVQSYSPPPALPNPMPVALDGTKATVTLTAIGTPRDVYVLSGKAVVKITIQANQPNGSQPLQAPSGDNAFLLLVPGFQAFVGVATVP